MSNERTWNCYSFIKSTDYCKIIKRIELELIALNVDYLSHTKTTYYKRPCVVNDKLL